MISTNRLVRWAGAMALFVAGGGLAFIALLALVNADYVAAKLSIAALEAGKRIHVEQFQLNWGWMYWSLLVGAVFLLVSAVWVAFGKIIGATVSLAIAMAAVSGPRVAAELWMEQFSIWHWKSMWPDVVICGVSFGLLVTAAFGWGRHRK